MSHTLPADMHQARASERGVPSTERTRNGGENEGDNELGPDQVPLRRITIFTVLKRIERSNSKDWFLM